MSDKLPIDEDLEAGLIERLDLSDADAETVNATRRAVAAYLRDEAEPLGEFLSPHGAEVLRLAADVLEDYERR